MHSKNATIAESKCRWRNIFPSGKSPEVNNSKTVTLNFCSGGEAIGLRKEVEEAGMGSFFSILDVDPIGRSV